MRDRGRGTMAEIAAAQLPVPLRVTRQVLAWFEPADHARARFAAERFPVFLLENGDGVFYGFPADADGVKVAKHHHLDEAVDADHYDRAISATDEAVIRIALKAHLPDADGRSSPPKPAFTP